MLYRYTTGRLTLKILGQESAPRTTDFFLRNRAHFSRWEIDHPEEYYTAAYQQRVLAAEETQFLRSQAVRYYLFRTPEPAPAGRDSSALSGTDSSSSNSAARTGTDPSDSSSSVPYGITSSGNNSAAQTGTGSSDSSSSVPYGIASSGNNSAARTGTGPSDSSSSVPYGITSSGNNSAAQTGTDSFCSCSVPHAAQAAEIPIGTVCFQHICTAPDGSCQVGYRLDAAHTGHGYMTEALLCLIPKIFFYYKLHRIEADILPENHPSLRLIQRLGFTQEGVTRGRYFCGGMYRDCLRFSLLSDDPFPPPARLPE